MDIRPCRAGFRIHTHVFIKVTNDNRLIAPFTETICCECVAMAKNVDGYDNFVFKDLNDNTYRMVTKLPNWEMAFIKIGDKGYMKYIEVLAGRDSWYDWKNGVYVPYKYDGQYILDWIPSRVK